MILWRCSCCGQIVASACCTAHAISHSPRTVDFVPIRRDLARVFPDDHETPTVEVAAGFQRYRADLPARIEGQSLDYDDMPTRDEL
jgi:hypothetical protein